MITDVSYFYKNVQFYTFKGVADVHADLCDLIHCFNAIFISIVTYEDKVKMDKEQEEEDDECRQERKNFLLKSSLSFTLVLRIN
jgi:hypothetical protein